MLHWPSCHSKPLWLSFKLISRKNKFWPILLLFIYLFIYFQLALCKTSWVTTVTLVPWEENKTLHQNDVSSPILVPWDVCSGPLGTVSPGTWCTSLYRGCDVRPPDVLDRTPPTCCLFSQECGDPWGLPGNSSELRRLPAFLGNLCARKNDGLATDLS